jgi:hypothetical protein
MQTGRLHASASSQSLDSLAESQHLEFALRAAEMILNDDIQGAEKILESGNSSFHKLAKGVILFLQAALGFEQDIMREASVQLADAETSASNDQYRSQHDTRSFHSEIYDKGSEFALCHAQAQIMSAVVGVMNESLTESIRGFYKLRKAYGTLDGLMEMENRYVKARRAINLSSSRNPSLESVKSGKSTDSGHGVSTDLHADRAHHIHHTANRPSALRNATTVLDDTKDDSDDSDEFYDADEPQSGSRVTKTYIGKLDKSPATSPTVERLANTSLEIHNRFEPEDSSDTSLPTVDKISSCNRFNLLIDGPDSDVFANPLDVFIHSGANLCFGLLSLLISIIPPAFGKLLYIIGFRGDRERGIQMLWQAAKFHNINGGMAGLILLGWYNGLVGFCDIVPDSNPTIPDDVEGHPIHRLEGLLNTMRKRYPKSQLWQLEEARMAASHRRLDEAITKLDRSGKSQLKQLTALHMFEKSLNAMFAHRYQLCADSFIACIDLNSWSHALYYYISGAAHLSLYRELQKQPGKQKEAAKQATLAEKDFKIAPTHIGKKKIMGRQLPFDVFVNRKVAKWEQRAQEWRCDFVDAVGVSPLEEMVYLWNGYKKMDNVQLERSLENLAWSESNPHWEKEGLDEKAILALLRSVVLRNQRKHREAKALLWTEILCHEPVAFKGMHRDDWTPPTAHYEMAVNLWMERHEYTTQFGAGPMDPERAQGQTTSPDLAGDAELVAECKKWVSKAHGWEKYELDARIGMKVTTAADAIKKWEAKHPGWIGPR